VGGGRGGGGLKTPKTFNRPPEKNNIIWLNKISINLLKFNFNS